MGFPGRAPTSCQTSGVPRSRTRSEAMLGPRRFGPQRPELASLWNPAPGKCVSPPYSTLHSKAHSTSGSLARKSTTVAV